VLKVYALYDAATDHYVASRIEADGGAANFKLRGMATALDTTAKTYQVGTTVIDYSAVTAPPPGLADNVVVTAILKTTPNADGSWPATALKLRNAGVPGDKVVVHVRGLVGAFVSLSSFTVDGVPVDASAATLPQGSAGIVSGASVQVDGVMNKGLLIASQVSVMAPGAHGGQDFELHGTVSNLDTTAQTFQVRSVPVSYAGTVTYAGGTAADLGSAKSVLVEGTLSSDGTSVQATHIRLYM